MAKYAVVMAGGHQHCIQENSILEVERIACTDAKEVKLNEVLLVREDGKVKVGSPYVKGASVVCEVLAEVHKPKVISFKFKRRQGYRRKKGHRQTLMRLLVKSIQTTQAE